MTVQQFQVAVLASFDAHEHCMQLSVDILSPQIACRQEFRPSDPTQVIKVYPGGKISNHVLGLKEGDELECKGPIPKIEYKANMKKRIGMVWASVSILEAMGLPCLFKVALVFWQG